jgi:hypothetical protein
MTSFQTYHKGTHSVHSGTAIWIAQITVRHGLKTVRAMWTIRAPFPNTPTNHACRSDTNKSKPETTSNELTTDRTWENALYFHPINLQLNLFRRQSFSIQAELRPSGGHHSCMHHRNFLLSTGNSQEQSQNYIKYTPLLRFTLMLCLVSNKVTTAKFLYGIDCCSLWQAIPSRIHTGG